MRLIRVLASVFLLAGLANAQSLTTITGTIKDGSGALITSGQVAFTLQPGVDTVTSGTARFTPTETDCTINGSGLVKALDGVSACTLVQNTSITTPSNTSYKACIQPGFIQPGSCFVFYATGSTLDITTVPATPSLTPAYNLVDTFSNQTIAGNKTFSGTVTFGGSLSLGAIVLGGAFTDLFGGTLGGTFAGNLTWSGTQTFNAAISAPSLTSSTANPATSGFARLARTDTECWRNFANSGNVCLSDSGAASSATGNFADNLQWNGGAIQATAFVGGGTPAGSGVLNTANNVCAVASENSLSNGDICAVKVNGSNQTALTNTVQDTINQAAATAFVIKDNQGGTRYSIPSGGVTQATLNNTSLTGTSNSNSVTLLDNQGASAAITGNSAAQNVFTKSIPGNTMQAGKGIRVRALWSHSSGTASVTYTVLYAGVSLTIAASAIAGTLATDFLIMNNPGVTNAQRLWVQGVTGNSTAFIGGAATGVFAADSTAAQTVAIQFNVANTDQVTPLMWVIETIN